jgi:hypothetical protein
MSATQPSQHVNFFQHIFGTSRISEIVNTAIVFLIAVIVFIFVVLPILRLLFDYLDNRRLRNRSLVFLELTPPALSTKTPYATAQLDNAMHGMLNSYTLKERVMRCKHTIALEFVGTRESGIRYIAVLSPHDVELFTQVLISHLPTVKYRQVEDYLVGYGDAQETRVMDFKQIGHAGFPLADHEKLAQHDPISSMINALARPLAGELSALQLVLVPAPPKTAAKTRAKLMFGQDPGMHHVWWHWPFIVAGKLLKVAFSIFTFVFQLIGEEISGNRTTYQSRQAGYIAPPIHPYTQHKVENVQAKLDESLFSVEVRALVIGQDSRQRIQSLANSLHQFHVPGYQGLVARRSLPFTRERTYNYRLQAFRQRSPAMFTMNSNVFGSSEVASLYHFPYGDVVQTEGLVKSLSKDLPAPLPMKQHSDASDFDVMLGANRYHGATNFLGLTKADREKHVYLLGGTGNGKTTMLEFAMVQDILNGKGVAFIDPHGDAAQKLLKYIPESRLKDVIYLNPIDIKYPIGINLLELPDGLDEDDLLIEKERVTEAVVSVLRKVFSDDDANAHRIEAMLRNAIRTVMTVPDATLFTVLKLLRNSEFRKDVVNKLEDEDLKDFWIEEFGQAGGMQRVSMVKGLTHRLDRFQSSAPAYRMFSQVKSTINFEQIMDEGKILICNFSTEMGEDTSSLFGTTVLAKLKIAAERRARIPEDERKPFYIYVDEFQNFATTPFVKMLAASRKYKLYLTIAQQSTKQQDDDRLTEQILANVSTVVCFRTGSSADAKLLEPWFEPQITASDISNLPAYQYYLRVRATQPMDATSGETVLLEDEGSTEIREQVKAISRELYAVEYKALLAAEKKTTKDSTSSTQKNNVSAPRKTVTRKAVRHTKQKQKPQTKPKD